MQELENTLYYGDNLEILRQGISKDTNINNRINIKRKGNMSSTNIRPITEREAYYQEIRTGRTYLIGDYDMQRYII